MKTLKDLRTGENLCYRLDMDVYLPVKKELEGINKEYSLGNRKETFKGTIENEMERIRQSAIEDVKGWLQELVEGGVVIKFLPDNQVTLLRNPGVTKLAHGLILIRSVKINLFMEKFCLTEEDISGRKENESI